MQVFDYQDYRSFLKAIITERPLKRGLQGCLAKAAGCHASYFSQALSGKVDLTLEQASKIAEYCDLAPLEAAYFVNLVLLERSGSKQLRQMTKVRLEELREKRFQVSGRTHNVEQLSEDHSFYFSNWTWAAIYTLSSLDEGLTQDQFKQKLELDDAVLKSHLDKLVNSGLLTKRINEDNEVTFSRSTAHLSLSADSPFLPAFHTSMRQLATKKILEGKNKGQICYSYFHAIKREDAEKIKDLITETLKNTHKMVQNTEQEEEVFLFNCDFLPI